jgi:hypothetical protein
MRRALVPCHMSTVLCSQCADLRYAYGLLLLLPCVHSAIVDDNTKLSAADYRDMLYRDINSRRKESRRREQALTGSKRVITASDGTDS